MAVRIGYWEISGIEIRLSETVDLHLLSLYWVRITEKGQGEQVWNFSVNLILGPLRFDLLSLAGIKNWRLIYIELRLFQRLFYANFKKGDRKLRELDSSSDQLWESNNEKR